MYKLQFTTTKFKLAFPNKNTINNLIFSDYAPAFF